MRCFVAIDIDQQVRDALGDLQQRLKSEVHLSKGDVKWVNPEKIHLTLKFLGEVDDKKIVEICNIVKIVTARNSRFDLNIEKVGSFGGRGARVLWVGIREGSEQLAKLQSDLENEFAKAAWPEEQREFAGHLTLCRIRNVKAGFKLADVSKNYSDYKIGTMAADSVAVYQSELTPQGPIYTVLGDYRLK